MSPQSSTPVLDNVRRYLGRTPALPLPERPLVLPARTPGNLEAEVELLMAEVGKLSGVARRLFPVDIGAALADLVATEAIQKATIWPALARPDIASQLKVLGVEIVDPYAEKHVLAQCDLGITGVDFALPETGTLALLSGPEKPRPVSLLPRVHLAILQPNVLRTDLHQIFLEAKNQPYMIFITGPSRTADIELTVALGVHGPKALYVWVLE